MSRYAIVTPNFFSCESKLPLTRKFNKCCKCRLNAHEITWVQSSKHKKKTKGSSGVSSGWTPPNYSTIATSNLSSKQKSQPRAVEFPADGLHQVIVQLLPVIYQANLKWKPRAVKFPTDGLRQIIAQLLLVIYQANLKWKPRAVKFPTDGLRQIIAQSLLVIYQANLKWKPRAVRFPADGLHQIIVQLLLVIYQANKKRKPRAVRFPAGGLHQVIVQASLLRKQFPCIYQYLSMNQMGSKLLAESWNDTITFGFC